jgi:tetratricopeptide (TPR) repeat protein
VNLQALTDLRGAFEQSVDRERLRKRVLASTGIWFLLAGMLAVLGFGAILVLSLTLAVGIGVVAGGLSLLRRYGAREQLRAALRSIERGSRAPRARLDGLGLQQHLKRFAHVASDQANTLRAGGRRGYATAVGRLRTPSSEPRQREPSAASLQRQALRLNELGAQLRRERNHEQAVQQHRAALAIMRDLGDRRGEALTLNNLALALVHTGSVSVAVQHFEQALVVLRELGDVEHEGQVIANVGFVRLRQGRDEDAESLLHAALDKLPPESSAYHKVEAQLRRAS